MARRASRPRYAATMPSNAKTSKRVRRCGDAEGAELKGIEKQITASRTVESNVASSAERYPPCQQQNTTPAMNNAKGKCWITDQRMSVNKHARDVTTMASLFTRKK